MSRMRMMFPTGSNSSRKNSEHDRHRPAPLAERRSQQCQPPVLGGELPVAAKISLIAVERDALASDWPAIEIERSLQAKRRVAEKGREALERKIGLLGSAEHDQPCLVFANEAAVRQPLRVGVDAVGSVLGDEQWI